MQQNEFHLVSVVALLQQKWKSILLIVLIAVITATITVFMVPPYYRSTATVIAANPLMADKARLFNNQIKDLYSYFGNGDDLDRIEGIAAMDTSYLQLVDSFHLIAYYELAGNDSILLRRKAELCLRKDLQVQKNEKGQLMIIAWTKNKQLSAALANSVANIMQTRETEIWEKNAEQARAAINKAIHVKETNYQLLSDSLAASNTVRRQLLTVKMQFILSQLQQYQQTADEFLLTLQTHMPALYVLENATPAAKAERPYKPLIIFAAALIGFVFSCLLILVTNRNTA
jgi:uncharacterized protein involved in exopolysaccharide biosynthesis